MFIALLLVMAQPASKPVVFQSRHAPFATLAMCEDWKTGETKRLTELFANASEGPVAFDVKCVRRDSEEDDGSI